jgi:hypothetical protein
MSLFFNLFLLVSTIAFGETFDHTHANLTKVLERNTSQKNSQTWVDYAHLVKTDHNDLKKYLKEVEQVSNAQYAAFTKDQQLAFLINAYNAFTLEWIVEHYPVKSIKDTGAFLRSPWKTKFPKYTFLGESFTLDSIEHDRIRKEFVEPRIHFAVNCASIGCPSLRTTAYTAKDLEKQLSDAEKDFFRNSDKFQAKGNKIKLSAILDWYGDDFKKVHGSVQKYIFNNAKRLGYLKDVKVASDLKIDFMDYNWDLNGK